jgi:alkanesulfonate monooxygenase SsuD/methylene tetrahydromethanopterin reductase-like flavin-dependent oxidoreductase (luciferase family)
MNDQRLRAAEAVEEARLEQEQERLETLAARASEIAGSPDELAEAIEEHHTLAFEDCLNKVLSELASESARPVTVAQRMLLIFLLSICDKQAKAEARGNR